MVPQNSSNTLATRVWAAGKARDEGIKAIPSAITTKAVFLCFILTDADVVYIIL
jgi:hypothetical protein